MEDYVELKLLGITYNQIESGVYALILEEPLSQRRLPIVIGYPEAQSIECKIQEVKTPRPLAHDVMSSIIRGLGGRVEGIYIRRLPSGVFAATIKIMNELGQIINIDSRSSDAIALAIRMDAPIYTTLELLEKSGFAPDKNAPKKYGPRQRSKIVKNSSTKSETKLETLSIDQLQENLLKAVADEKYEEAAQIKEELEKRNSKTE